MNCQSVHKIWERYLHGDVSLYEQQEVQQHIQNCLQCQASLGYMGKWLAQLKVVEVKPRHKVVTLPRIMIAAVVLFFVYHGSTFFSTTKSSSPQIQVLSVESYSLYSNGDHQVISSYELGDVDYEQMDDHR